MEPELVSLAPDPVIEAFKRDVDRRHPSATWTCWER